MGFGLEAPAIVTVEVRTDDAHAHAPNGRVFRLSRAISVEGIRLSRPAPVEIGREVTVTLRLPDARMPENPDPDLEPGGPVLSVRARVETTGDGAEADGERGGTGLRFVALPSPERDAITTYVLERLGLPRAKGAHVNANNPG
jgi:hypothetical protein